MLSDAGGRSTETGRWTLMTRPATQRHVDVVVADAAGSQAAFSDASLHRAATRGHLGRLLHLF